MPKHDAFSPKAIANRQKSVGLQKLRWYCQLCEKQCRDENGFKCHTMSEGHLRMMRVFAENPNRMLDEFSREFEKTFLQILSHRHGTKKVAANKVYQEVIADKSHIHMNATVWTTLTGFCMYLGREGKAIVEETEKGWFIQYIERDPRVLERQAEIEARKQLELDEEQKQKRLIEAQIKEAQEKERAREAQRAAAEAEEQTSTQPGASGEHGSGGQGAANVTQTAPVVLSAPKVSLQMKKRKAIAAFGGDEDENEDDGGAQLSAKKSKASNIERLMLQEQERKSMQNHA